MAVRHLMLMLAAALWAAAPASAVCTAVKFGELAVTMEGLRPIVPASLNGTEVKFIADSGAFYSLISPSVAAQLALRLTPTPPNFQLRGIGGAASSATTLVKRFGIAGATVPDVTFLVGGSDTGRAGLIGQNVLGLFDTEFDLAGGMIRLLRTKDCGKTNLAYWAGDKPVQELPLLPGDLHNRHVGAYVTVNGVRLLAEFDTGSPTSVLTRKAAARAGVTPDDPDSRRAGVSGGLGRALVESWTAPFRTILIGAEEIKNARIRFADMPGVPFDMLLGADFFLSHRVFVSRTNGRIFLTYNGGPVFNLTAAGATAGVAAPATVPSGATATGAAPQTTGGGVEPTDADGLARRGAASAARRDFTNAFADLGRAIALAPDEPRYRVARANAYLANRQPLLARTDLDAAIKRAPGDTDALATRAALFLLTRHRPEALVDIDAAAAAAPKEADLRLHLAGLYAAAEAPRQAIAQYDLWLDIHKRDDRRSPQALNGRCWARALLGEQLRAALDDCNAALRLVPNAAAFLDSRGLVRLRLGDLDKAITDFDASLVLQPRLAWSLYGRGIARRRKGMTAQGDADVAAAVAIDPGLTDQAQRYGIDAPAA